MHLICLLTSKYVLCYVLFHSPHNKAQVTDPEAFENSYTRDLVTSLQLKSYKDQRMDNLFQSIEALESEGRASNKVMEEAVETQINNLNNIIVLEARYYI